MAKHIAWDFGAVTGIFGSILKQKTVKTLCGRTVRFVDAGGNETRPECVECTRLDDERNAFMRSIGIKA